MCSHNGHQNSQGEASAASAPADCQLIYHQLASRLAKHICAMSCLKIAESHRLAL